MKDVLVVIPPPDFYDLPHQTLCFISALSQLRTETKDLTDKEIISAFDRHKGFLSFGEKVTKGFCPDYSFIQHTRQMHQIIFSHLIQLVNPTDVARTHDVFVNEFKFEAAKVEAKVEVFLMLFEKKHQYAFSVRYDTSFSLRVLLKNIKMPTPYAPRPKIQFRPRSAIRSSNVPAASQANGYPAIPSDHASLNYSAIPDIYKRVFKLFSESGIVPQDGFEAINQYYLEALEKPYSSGYRDLVTILHKPQPTEHDVKAFMQKIRADIISKRSHLFAISG